MEKLKKCPFCGGEAELIGNRFFRVMCTECNAHIEDFETAIEAITAWNTREPIERIVDRLEENLSIARQSSYGNEISLGIASGLNLAIEIVKEEMS